MATLFSVPPEAVSSGQRQSLRSASSNRSPVAISTEIVSSLPSSNHDIASSQLPSPTSPNNSSATEMNEESGFELVDGNIKLFESNKLIVEKNYATSTDTRGLIPVYEYQIGSNRTNKVIVDRQTGYVLITGIWKALGRLKTDVVKLIESQPSIAPVVRKIRGGVLDIQGTWLPFEIAKKLAQRVAWPLRDELVPIFGPTFPPSCLAPGQLGFGDLVLSEPPLHPPARRTPRDLERRAKAKQAARAAQNNSSISTISQAKASRQTVPDPPIVEEPTPTPIPAPTPAPVTTPRLPSPSPTPPATAIPSTSKPKPVKQPKQPKQTAPPLPPPPTPQVVRCPIVQHPSQAGPVRHEWKGYDAPLQPSRTYFNYSTYWPSTAPSNYDPRFFAQPFASSCCVPTGAYSSSTRYRSISNPYPVSEYGRQRIRLPSGTVLPPRSSFSSFTPALATPIASLRSTINRPPSPMRGLSTDSEKHAV